jgi:antitoxin YefM
MDAKTFDDAVANLDALIDQAVDDAEPIIITRTGKPAAVLISLDEWNSIQTTLHLLRSPTNRRRLEESMRDADAGRGVERPLAAE